MKCDGFNELRFKNGGNEEVTETVRSVFEEYRCSLFDFVRDLQGAPFQEQCFEVFRFVAENILYREDSGFDQMIKTPARLLNDAVGDCKSMSVFIASAMWCLGADSVMLRFVGFTDEPAYTHVYCLASKNGETYILDPVERSKDGKCVFNWARPFKIHKDYSYTRNG